MERLTKDVYFPCPLSLLEGERYLHIYSRRGLAGGAGKGICS